MKKRIGLVIAIAALALAAMACSACNLPNIGGGGGSSGSGDASVVLHNNTGQSIWYVYISPTAEDTWGPDMLGTDTIPAGATWTFRVNPGNYDLRADFQGHEIADQRMGVSISGTYDWTIR